MLTMIVQAYRRTFKFIVLIVGIAMSSAQPLLAQNFGFQWANALQPAVQEAAISHSVVHATAVDRLGNVYVTGSFSGKVTFGQISLTSLNKDFKGEYGDVFVAKYNANGTCIWAASSGGANSDVANAIAVDKEGNVYVAGTYWGTSTFGSSELRSAGEGDAFVAKLNNGGQWQWAKSGGGTGFDEVTAISLDKYGSPYITGNTLSSTVSFGGTQLVRGANLTAAFVARLDAKGTFLWATTGEDEISDGTGIYSRGVAVNSKGDACVVGYFYSRKVRLGGITLTKTGSEEENSHVLIAKVSSTGQWKWAVSGGSTEGKDFATAVAVDSNDNFYVTGSLVPKYMEDVTTCQFGSISLTTGAVLFVAKLNPDGQYQWAVSVDREPTGIAQGYGIAVDNQGGIYVAGSTGGGGKLLVGSTALEASRRSPFVAKINENGKWLWGVNGHADLGAEGVTVAADNAGNVYLGGHLYESTQFGNTTLTTSNGEGYIARVVELPTALTLWPNPGREMVWVGGLVPRQQVQVYDVTGRLLATETSPENGLLQLKLTNTLPVGVYIVRSGKQVQRLLIE